VVDSTERFTTRINIVKKIAACLLLATALISPGAVLARDVTIQTEIGPYLGNAAYLAIYLTEPDGSYHSTLWLAGRKIKYLAALRGWVRSVSEVGSVNVDGITGASVGAGETLIVHADLADALLEAGYVIHVDTAVENGGAYADDAVIPLSATAQPSLGAGYVGALSLTF
jgi:hypothetical protein